MLLYERGLLSLESPVAAILPEFRLAGSSATTGGPRSRDASDAAHPFQRTARLCQALRVCTHSRRTHSLGSNHSAGRRSGSKADYSDIGFILLGEILEHLAGSPLDVLAKNGIFAPLGMSRTCFNPPAEWKFEIPPTEDDRTFRHRVVQGEVNDENAWVMGGVAGHAGLFASATDVARFAECMLRGGSPILQPDHGRAIHSPGSFAYGHLSRHGMGHAITAILVRRTFLSSILSGTSALPALLCGSIPTASSA